MIDLIKKKELKGIIVSLAIIALSIFLIIKPEEIIASLLKVIGIFVLIFGVFDFTNYFITKDESKIFDYGLFKGIMEITIGALFIFKGEELINLFPMILGLLIVFINIFKLQLSLSLKQINEEKYLIAVLSSSVAIILGAVIIFNPFESLKLAVMLSGILLLISELFNIVYSIIVLKHIKRSSKVVRNIIEQ